MYIQILTFIHVAISLIGIGSGLVVMVGLLTGKRLNNWTALFLATTVATSVTGFFFPIHKFTPGIGVGIISLLVLALAIPGLYIFHLAGAWRWIYTIGSVLALYLNVFVGIVQAFQKIPALNSLAPTQSEPPFLFTQLVVLVLFALIGIFATIKFRLEPIAPQTRTA